MEPITTVNIYRADLDWLKRRQLQEMLTTSTGIHMADILHDVIVAVKRAEEGA